MEGWMRCIERLNGREKGGEEERGDNETLKWCNIIFVVVFISVTSLKFANPIQISCLTHSADKPYNCTRCSKAFKTPLQLKKHETVHTGAEPHQCAVCGRTFREKGTLREHHRIHTGAMPFTCEFCGKCFRFKGILTTHRSQHTGERPYSCLECQHHFTNWPNYNKHMKRRHGINTSHTKHLSQSQQSESQQLHQPQQQSEQSQTVQSNTSEDPLPVSPTESPTVQNVL
ncbi:zinc finger protein 793-like [Hylaeus anthracinus]|uniref:zinc finger protein 793-like n=1 Tax=Hylaeus anthracinus TaxID=313031 RepID=UPI0023B9954B|nr:zinc finger protein 793-like [Hylaeus anthracinus]